MESVKKNNKKDEYLKKLQDSLFDAYNIIDNTIMYITKEYNYKMSFHVELSKLYNLKKEYNGLVKKQESRKTKLDKIYRSALERLDKCTSFPDEALKKYLYDIRSEYRTNMLDGIKAVQMLPWKKANAVISKREYKNMYSRINNLATLVSKRLMEAKKVYQKICELNYYYVVKNTMKNLDSTLEYDQISELIASCTNRCDEINKKSKSGKSDFSVLINSSSKLSEDDLTLNVLQHIDRKIGEILEPAYLSFLNNHIKYQSLTKVYNEEKPNVLKSLSKYKKKIEKIKNMILHNMYLKYNELENVNVLNNKNTNVLGNKTERMPLGELINLASKINQDLDNGKKEFIHNGYLSIIYFYAGNDILKEMPDIVYDTYIRFLTEEKDFNMCFNIIKQQYFKCYYSTTYDLENNNDQDHIDRANQNLINNIDRMFNSYMNMDIEIDPELVQIYHDRMKLDTISLYELYEKLRRTNIFKTHEEIKFSK